MIFFYGLVGLVVLLDQLTKALAVAFLSENSAVAIPGVLHLTLVRNTGVAFGFMSDHSSLLFSVITVSLVLLFILVARSRGASLSEKWALSLILGGAIGNWIDRFRIGAVVDFLDFRIWPVFNLADTAITVGVGIYLLSILRAEKKE
ncbi:MAG TPA: signal peptidase II [Candidatus Omnitrophota bacterium]|nr:MAG: Lipoprotein signal peptidase [Candidatus Omnitrophica bacterium ADurb.Bin314]HOE68443.1 signal peptidase II [Candidatus Omnitrophota bacterium]HQB93749.1 signal peptidase II [Candidatus Omnitrophota bacterium]